MIPLSIEHSGRGPWLTGSVVVLMLIIFSTHGMYDVDIVQFFGLVPIRMWSAETWSLLGPVEQCIPWFAYPLLHASPLHLAGNLWGLWVFGSAVESIGRVRFIVLWLATSWASGATYLLIQPEQVSPLIGASGCVAGMIGFCCVQPQGTHVKTWVPWRPMSIVRLNSWIFFLGWFSLTILAVLTTSNSTLAIAGWIHGGGFLMGCLAGIFARVRGSKTIPLLVDLSINDDSNEGVIP